MRKRALIYMIMATAALAARVALAAERSTQKI